MIVSKINELYLWCYLSLFFLGLGANTLLSDKSLQHSCICVLGVTKIQDFYEKTILCLKGKINESYNSVLPSKSS